jgi:hypothetical protein
VSRDVILQEHRAAAKATISKKRNIERLKGSSKIQADRVDEALEELDDVRPTRPPLHFSLTPSLRLNLTNFSSPNDSPTSHNTSNPPCATTPNTPTKTSSPPSSTTPVPPSSTKNNSSKNSKSYAQKSTPSRSRNRGCTIILSLHTLLLPPSPLLPIALSLLPSAATPWETGPWLHPSHQQ